jgi:hypothetical protein
MGEYDFTLGIDMACSAARVATLADVVGRLMVGPTTGSGLGPSNSKGLRTKGPAGSPAAGDGAHPECVGAVGCPDPSSAWGVD